MRDKLTVLSVIGTRPEAIKMAPVVQAFQKESGVRSLVCSTGQHREMLKQSLDLFDITPDEELAVMTANQSLSALTAHLLTGLDRVAQKQRPDWILAQGDTTTVLAASLTAHYHRIKFGHVEAGLRTYDKYRPFPEEMNRRLTDVLADLRFAPTELAREALLKENIDPKSILITGNTIVDALLSISEKPYEWDSSTLRTVDQKKPIVLITAHRRESFGEVFSDMCSAIRDLAERFPDTQFVYPVHLNPNVQEPVRRILQGKRNLMLLEPVDYLCLVNLMKHTTLILTDSGGIQEEAPTFGVPVLVMRDKTERPEGIAAGVSELVGTSREKIVNRASVILKSKNDARVGNLKNPYGDGKAAARIVKAVLAN